MSDYNKVLIVDDTIDNLNILKTILESEDYEVFISKDGYKAIEIAKELKPDIILLDIMMPGIDGYKTCEILKSSNDTKDIPIIFLSALTQVDEKVKGFDLGAVDYISKPIQIQEVLSRVKVHLNTSQLIHSLNNLVEKSFHEIYTPLSVISSAIELQILEHGNTEYLQSIKSASRLLNIFSDDMYYSIKKEIATFESVWIELEPFFKKQLIYLAPILKNKNMEFSFNCEVENPMIFINEIELQRIVLNILSNAIKYGYKDSTINIIIKMLEDNKILFSIENTGKVIENTKKVFKKLFQEDKSFKGWGMGLEIVSLICKKHDIDVNVVSVDNNTKFEFIYKEEE